jgi:hypothetical protein
MQGALVTRHDDRSGTAPGGAQDQQALPVPTQTAHVIIWALLLVASFQAAREESCRRRDGCVRHIRCVLFCSKPLFTAPDGR